MRAHTRSIYLVIEWRFIQLFSVCSKDRSHHARLIKKVEATHTHSQWITSLS